MPTDLAQHIQNLRIFNTHEHQTFEDNWVNDGTGSPHGALGVGPRDVLEDLFSSYERGDLNTAGASNEDVNRAIDPTTGTIEERWALIAGAWESTQFTGYGEAVRLHAEHLYGIDHITPQALRDAQPELAQYRQRGGRLRLLRDVAHMDHIQTDMMEWPCAPDASGPDFFLYDLSMWHFAQGIIESAKIERETKITVRDLASLDSALEAIFAKYAPIAVAVKSQHAYNRPLAWRPRSDVDAAAALAAVLRDAKMCSDEEKVCLGDWCIDRVASLCAQHNLPFKIHTGHFAGTGYMSIARLPASNLNQLLIKHPRTRFVLMHIAYPYHHELTAIAKHFANVWVDLCWAWSIDPYSTMDFVRRFIHAVPINKLFGHGGDCVWPTRGVAFALQTRRWLTRALEKEVADGSLTEPHAIGVADRLLRENQKAVFDLDGKRRNIRARLQSAAVTA